MYVQNIVAPMPQQQQAGDNSVLSNDSGVVDQQVYQPPIQYSYQYQPQPVPVYYGPGPVLQPPTPQVTTQIAPVFSGPAIMQHTPSVQPETAIAPFTESTAVNFTQSQGSEHTIKAEPAGAPANAN